MHVYYYSIYSPILRESLIQPQPSGGQRAGEGCWWVHVRWSTLHRMPGQHRHGPVCQVIHTSAWRWQTPTANASVNVHLTTHTCNSEVARSIDVMSLTQATLKWGHLKNTHTLLFQVQSINQHLKVEMSSTIHMYVHYQYEYSGGFHQISSL